MDSEEEAAAAGIPIAVGLLLLVAWCAWLSQPAQESHDAFGETQVTPTQILVVVEKEVVITVTVYVYGPPSGCQVDHPKLCPQ